MDINKMYTDVVDFIASKVGELWAKDSAELPDMSVYDISRLITEEEAADPEKYYKGTSEVPGFTFKRTQRLPLVDIYEGDYPSLVRTPFPENNTVYATLYKLRRGKKGRPIVVMINGLHVDTNFYFDWWCWRFAAWGLDSVLINMPYAMRRVPPKSFSGQFTMTPDTMWTLLSIKQSFLDLQLLVNRLNADGYGKIGTFGVSYGALMSGIYVCKADNAHFAVLGMPPVDFVDVIHKWSFADELQAREAAGETTMLTDPRLPGLLSVCEMTPRVPLSNIFIAAGTYDHLVTMESIDGAEKRWGRLPWLIKYPTGHINTFVFNVKFIMDVRKFIYEEIL